MIQYYNPIPRKMSVFDSVIEETAVERESKAAIDPDKSKIVSF